MREKSNIKYACLFGGGAIRGAAHVGVIKALEEFGIEPVLYGGSSVGSIVAVLWALGYSVEEIKEIFLDVNFELFRDISFGFNRKFALSKGEVFLDWFRELVESKFYGDKYKKGENEPVKFKDLKKNVVIITTNMRDFKCKEFSTFLTPDFEIATAVRISCCMPGLMRAYNYDDMLLVDGDLMKGKPMWSLSENVKNIQDRVLEIRLEGSFSGSDENPIEYVNGMYSCITSSETDFVKSVYNNYDKYDYLVVDTGDVIVVDFNCSKSDRAKLVDSGYLQAKTFFSNELLSKKKSFLEIYTTLNEWFLKIENLFRRKKYEKAKNTVAQMYIYLAKVGNIIDAEIFSKIDIFQKLVFSSVKHGLLDMVYCDNYEEIMRQIIVLISYNEEKISECLMHIDKFSV